ncbi:DUF6193 family natural product biosynthesis protein [Streptomyces sp. NPDC001941]|uniref:DUF6193 family natural product biosynthesis protein n=1 Tax=Streptomyces sp. NPDC001941 TaxID=3154659 RepID=UPI00332500FF
MADGTGGESGGPFGRVEPAHYPDLAAGGGLLRVLRSTARERGVDPESIGTRSRGVHAGYTSVVIELGTATMRVGLAIEERGFSVGIGRDWLHVANGWTEQLRDLLDLARAWREGAGYEELARSWPFLTFSPLAMVLAAPDPVAAQWELLLTAPEFAEDRPLVEAAHAVLGLRDFFPDLSHRALRLSRSYRESAGAVTITPLADGTARVDRVGEATAGETYAVYPDAAEAAAALLGRTPPASGESRP